MRVVKAKSMVVKEFAGEEGIFEGGEGEIEGGEGI